MNPKTLRHSLALVFVSLNLLVLALAPAPAMLPVTGQSVATAAVFAPLPSLERFVSSVATGQAGVVTGVYVSGTLALPVLQQPASNPAYVSRANGRVTQFSLAAQRGTTAFLAHNYLAGAQFFNLSVGQEVVVVYGDGGLRRYVVSAARRFQALSPESPYSNFVDLDTGGAQLSAADLFAQVYGGGDQVVFQTCIRANGNASWGRLFVIATPIP